MAHAPCGLCSQAADSFLKSFFKFLCTFQFFSCVSSGADRRELLWKLTPEFSVTSTGFLDVTNVRKADSVTFINNIYLRLAGTRFSAQLSNSLDIFSGRLQPGRKTFAVLSEEEGSGAAR